MKILLITNQDTTLRFREELISELRRFCDLSICTHVNQDREWVESLGLEIYDLPIDRRGKNIFKELRTFSFILNTVKKSKPDVILTFTIKPNLYAGFIAKLLGIPMIMTITGLGSGIEESRTKRILLWGYRLIQSKTSVVVFQNKSSMELFSNKKIAPLRQILVNGSGVNGSKFTYQTYPLDKPLRLLFLGRIMKSKGIEELADAIKYFYQQNQALVFDIVGPMEEDVSSVIQDLEQTGIVKYHGYQTDVTIWIQQAHALVHPTYHEGMSNVLLEASAMGRPVLASNIPGCKEIVEDGITGFLFEARNANSLIQAVERFIHLTMSEREEMGKLARKKVVNEFDRDDIVKTYIELIKQFES